MKIFISYTSSDRGWAHWIGWQLKNADHEPFVHEWEIGAGQNIPRWMEDRLKQADRLIGVFSDEYCGALYSQSERWAAYWQDPGGRSGFLVPIQVRKVSEWPIFVEPLKRLSLLDLEESEAAKRLVAFLEPPKAPSEKPAFPGAAPTDSLSLAKFVEGSEPLGVAPPSFPAAPPSTQHTRDPNVDIRCIDDYQPKPRIFGRDDEIKKIVDAVLEGKVTLVAGGPGMGKTALATTAFYDDSVVRRFGRRRIFASLEAATEARAVLAKLVEALGVPPTGDDVTLLRILEASSAEQPLAAILDNAETVFDADRATSERLLNVVAQIKGLSLVVTIRGVPPPIPGVVQIDDLPKLDGGASQDAFLAIAGALFSGDSDLPHLLEALDGHALSIHLVAAQAIGLPSLKGLRESWDETHAEILRISGQEEGRLTSVRASLALSLNSNRMKSTPLAKRLAALLAFLPAGLPEAHAQSLLGDRGTLTKARANEAVVCLHQLRLVERRLDRRLRMLTPLRECVKSDVKPLGVDQQRLVGRYLSLATQALTIGTRDWEKYRVEVEEEADNLDSVCEVAVATSLTDRRLEEALAGLGEYHALSGRGAVGSLGHAVGRLKARPPTRLLGRCIHRLGDIARTRSDHETALARFEEALTLFRRIGNVFGEANCIQSLGDLAFARSDHETALARLEEALALYRRVDGVLGEANCIQGLGDLAFARSDHETALARLEEALALYRRVGSVLGEANCIQGLGDIASALSDHKTALVRFEEALALYRRIGSVSGEANCIQSLGDIAFARSDHETALARLEVALALYRRIGGALGEANCIRSLGDIARARSDHETALARLGEALALYRRVDSVLGEANCIRSLGDIARARSDHETALARLGEALALFRRIGSVSGEANCIQGLGDLARARSDHETALARFEEALALYRRIGAVGGEAITRVRLGQIQKVLGGIAEGLTNIESGFALYFKFSDPYDLALPGWRAMHVALACSDTEDAAVHRDLAKSNWTAIGRTDLVQDWVDAT